MSFIGWESWLSEWLKRMPWNEIVSRLFKQGSEPFTEQLSCLFFPRLPLQSPSGSRARCASNAIPGSSSHPH